jgi:hypothetical protein
MRILAEVRPARCVMNSRINAHICQFALFTLISLAAMSCAHEPKFKESDAALFARIKIGMNRSEVEKTLGSGLDFHDVGIFYGQSPKLEPWQSPIVPRTICVFYSTNNLVKTKIFYGQHPELYVPTSGISEDLKGNLIVELKIMHVSDSNATIVCKTPDQMDTYSKEFATQKIDLRFRQSFQQAINSTRASWADEDPNLCWAIFCLDKNGTKIHSIYLDRRYVNVLSIRGVIDEQPVLLNDSLTGWLERNFMRQ